MLAIVIPYYKAVFFEAALESVANQTDKRFRLYIGNDNSPEDPTAILDKLRDRLDFEYRFFDTNLGGTSLVSQWERCLAMIKDESWVMILGDDDQLQPNVVETFHANIDKTDGVNVIRMASVKIDDSGRAISQVYTHPELEKSTDFLFRESRSSLGEYIFRVEELRKTGFADFQLAWYSDLMAVLEISDFGNVLSLNEGVVSIRISGHSISGNKGLQQSKNKAAAAFYHKLCSVYRSRFDSAQLARLEEKLEKLYVWDKSNLKLFIKIATLHLKHKSPGKIARLVKKTIGAATRSRR